MPTVLRALMDAGFADSLDITALELLIGEHPEWQLQDQAEPLLTWLLRLDLLIPSGTTTANQTQIIPNESTHFVLEPLLRHLLTVATGPTYASLAYATG